MRTIFFSTLIGVVLLSGGCAWLQRAQSAATTVDPATGQTPIQTVIREVPHVISNPLDIPAWLQIVGAITGVVLTASAGYAVKQRAATTSATETLVELKEQQLEALSPPAK